MHLQKKNQQILVFYVSVISLIAIYKSQSNCKDLANFLMFFEGQRDRNDNENDLYFNLN